MHHLIYPPNDTMMWVRLFPYFIAVDSEFQKLYVNYLRSNMERVESLLIFIFTVAIQHKHGVSLILSHATKLQGFGTSSSLSHIRI